MKTRFPRLWTVAPTLLLLPFLAGSSAVGWWGIAAIRRSNHEYEAAREQLEALADVVFASDKYLDEIEGSETMPMRIERARDAVYAAIAVAEATNGSSHAAPAMSSLRQRFSIASAHLEASMPLAISSGRHATVAEVHRDYVHHFKEPVERGLRRVEQEASASAARSERIVGWARSLAAGFLAVAIVVGAGFILLALRQLRERRAAEAALLASEQRVRTVMETLPDAVVVHRDGQVLFSNPAARALSSDSTLPAQLLIAARGATGEVTIEVPSHNQRTLDLTSRAINFSGGAAVLVLARDITESIEMRKRLTHSERLASVGTLAAGVAHEVNNPIAFVLSNLDYALAELKPGGAPDSGEELVEALEEAKQGAVRVAAIVRDLKLLARQDAPVETAVDLRTLLDSACRFTAHETRHRAKIIQEVEDVPLTLADETRLGQVFINLIVNAAHAIPAGHAAANKITVRTRQHGERIIAEVEDTGSGIPAHLLPRIFDPFFTTKPVGVGTGLGLSISHSIIVGLGGTLSVKSEPGRGTTFTVSLPIRAPEPEPAPASTGLQSPARMRILIVDDERLFGLALKRTLGAQHDVESCVDASEALALIRTRKPYDVVLCDLMMPNMTGMEFYDVIRREAPKVAAKFVFMTGGACTEETEAFIKTTEAAILSKPFQPAQLFDVLPKQRGMAMN